MTKTNKNQVVEGNYVTYTYAMVEDSYNGSEGTVEEVIDNDSDFVIMARVRWTTGEVSIVPVNNLYPQEKPSIRAA